MYGVHAAVRDPVPLYNVPIIMATSSRAKYAQTIYICCYVLVVVMYTQSSTDLSGAQVLRLAHAS